MVETVPLFLYTNPPTPIGTSSFCQNKLYCTKKGKKKKKLHLCTVRYKDISLTPVHTFSQLKIRALKSGQYARHALPHGRTRERIVT